MRENKRLSCPDCGCESFVQEDIGEIRCMKCKRTFGTGITAEILMRCEDAAKLAGVDDEMVESMRRLMENCPSENVMKHGEICVELNSLYERKNHDYGDSFHQSWMEEGAAAAMKTPPSSPLFS